MRPAPIPAPNGTASFRLQLPQLTDLASILHARLTIRWLHYRPPRSAALCLYGHREPLPSCHTMRWKVAGKRLRLPVTASLGSRSRSRSCSVQVPIRRSASDRLSITHNPDVQVCRSDACLSSMYSFAHSMILVWPKAPCRASRNGYSFRKHLATPNPPLRRGCCSHMRRFPDIALRINILLYVCQFPCQLDATTSPGKSCDGAPECQIRRWLAFCFEYACSVLCQSTPGGH